MISLPKKHWTSIAVLAGMLLVLSVLVAPAANAATARTLTIRVNPATTYGGSVVTFAGRVTKSGKGKVVKIQRKSGSSWVLARTTRTTNAIGSYSVRVTVPSAAAVYTYRAYAAATPTLKKTYSTGIKVTALRHTAAVITATPASISLGGSSTLSGTVHPYVASTSVALQRLSGSSWVTVANVPLSSTGAFSGSVTPAETTTYRVSVPRTALNGATTSSPTVVTVGPATPAPVITTTSLPNGAKGVAYSATLTKTGGAGTWSKSAGTTPPGIALDPNTGALAGTPTASGTFNFTIKFAETATGLSATKALSIVVTPPPTITTTSLPDGTRGVAYTTTLTHSGGAGTWSLTGGLPAGLSLDASTGVISGVPSAHTGTYGVYPTFTETATGLTAFKPLALNIVGTDVSVTTTSLPDATKGVPYSVGMTKTGGAGTWSMIINPDDAATTSNLSIDPATGVISGTPTHSGQYAVYVAFTETATGSIATKALALNIANSPVITTTSVPDGTTGAAYSQQLAKTGQAGTWSHTGGILPDGVTLSASGLLSGTPADPGDYGFTVTFTETSTGYTDTQQLLLHVSNPGAPVINTTTLPSGTVGTGYSSTLSATPAGGAWSVTYGSLPGGLSLNPATGAITGTPTAAGDSLFQVTYTTLSGFNTKVLGIHIAPAPTP